MPVAANDYAEDLKELEEVLENKFVSESVNCKLPNHGADVKDKDLAASVLEFMTENEELFKGIRNDGD